jgi:LAO/AO transport system kinase
MTLDLKARRRLARRLSAVEDEAPEAAQILVEAYSAPPRATILGVTGPPGAGKSTLVDRLAVLWAGAGHEVAIIAADPWSPFSGGAVLGDRVRMGEAAGNPRVYLRSMSVRGETGGVVAAVADLCAVLDHHGISRIILETVGAGQSDIEIASAADCVLAVSVPGLGDSVQAIKAGLLEIADIHIVNKCDLPGADITRQQIGDSLGSVYRGQEGLRRAEGTAREALAHAIPRRLPGVAALLSRHGDPAGEAATWRPPVLGCAARTGEGTDAVAAEVDSFLDWADESGRLATRRAARVRRQILRLVERRLLHDMTAATAARAGDLDVWCARIVEGRASPHDAAAHLRESLLHAPEIDEGAGAPRQKRMGGPG